MHKIIARFLTVALLGCSISSALLADHRFNIMFADNTITNPNDNDTFDINTNGEACLLQNYLKAGFVVFDVGAHVGEWSLKALSLNPNIYLFSFEPTPSSYEKLSHNLPRTSAQLFNLAFSASKGRQRLFTHLEEFSGINSLFWRNTMHYDRCVNEGFHEVEVDTIDDFCATHLIEKIDFLKIDTEGSELDILKGARNLLQQNKIIGIQFEYGGTFHAAKSTLREIVELLTKSIIVFFAFALKAFYT